MLIFSNEKERYEHLIIVAFKKRNVYVDSFSLSILY